ncbi:MAG TPA: nitrilase-related carbon-nitrogen hydrolase, partial [Ardenticatenaceae bacterium]
MRTVRLAMAQINTTVGDLEGNCLKILDYLERARAQGAGLVMFPELATSGYPPEDLLLKPDFIAANQRVLEEIRRATEGITVVVGFPACDEYDIYNAAAVFQNGQRLGTYHKHFLPNYGVFDENRYFGEGLSSPVFDFEGDLVGVNICEDIWYPSGPPQWQAQAGAELLVNISASPNYGGKGHA